MAVSVEIVLVDDVVDFFLAGVEPEDAHGLGQFLPYKDANLIETDKTLFTTAVPRR